MRTGMDHQTEIAVPEATREDLAALAKLLGDVTKLRAEEGKIVVELKLALPLAFSITDLESASNVSRSSIYEEIGRGKLAARRVGDRRTIVTLLDAIAWLQALPRIKGRGIHTTQNSQER